MNDFKNEQGAVIIYVLIISAFLMLITPILFDMILSSKSIDDKNEDLKLITLSTVSGMESFLEYIEDVKDDLVIVEELYEFDENSGREDLRYHGYTGQGGIDILLSDGTLAKYIMDIEKVETGSGDSLETYYEVSVSTSIGSGAAKQEKTITYKISSGSSGGDNGGDTGGDNGGDTGGGNEEPNIPDDVNDDVEENENIGLKYILGEDNNAKFLKQTEFWFDVATDNYRFVEYHYITDDHDNRTEEAPIGTNNSVYCYINTSIECSDVDTNHTITTSEGNLGIIQYKIVTQTIEQFHDGKQQESFWITPFGVSFNSSNEIYVWFTPDEFINESDPNFKYVKFLSDIPGDNNSSVTLDYNDNTGKYDATIPLEEPINRLDYQFKFERIGIDKIYNTQSIDIPVHGVELSEDKKEAIIWYVPDDNNLTKYNRVYIESILPRQDPLDLTYNDEKSRFEEEYTLPPISVDGVTIDQPISLIQYYIVIDKNNNDNINENRIERGYWNTFWDPDLSNRETIFFERIN
ncbi:hypothetical protein [Chengkuizengella axinellae]|uniref:Flp pilus-assembly TadG-like N-terminal domain-containing protein n=1 Tax=Chengkuizengella axinellae TaxID=3064388 RepID=A0ABT9IY66_9BACL|nr:hypothetical protein [Chengkuizengella sp. 2205SS18-9]MDP5274296.1 hypothetical protein [Chengkuizengella sp. 2205SS18-9]